MATEFMSPYQVQKILKGVVPANKLVRPNWLQTFFASESTTTSETVNFDYEFQTKNTMGMFVSPTADVTPIQLATFGTAELRSSYAKEGLSSPDYDEIKTRRIGQQFGQVNDPMLNERLDLQQKLALAEQRFENLFEKCAANIIFTGGYTAASEKHPTIAYDFGRQKVTTEAAFNTGYVPSVDLSTITISAFGGAGKKAWNATGGTIIPTPVKDLITMANTAFRRQSGVRTVVMSSDAYEYFEADVQAKYKDASTLTQSVMLRVEQRILPMVTQYQGLNYRRSFPVGNGVTLDIYTYDGVYHDRYTGAETAYVPNGYVALLPDPSLGIKVYFRIQHPKANYEPMPRWINYWMNEKTGKKEWEVHTSFLLGHTDINSVVCWKVLA